MRDKTLLHGTELAEVPPRVQKTKSAIRTTPYLRRLRFRLPVVVPKANLAYLVSAELSESEIAAARARVFHV